MSIDVLWDLSMTEHIKVLKKMQNIDQSEQGKIWNDRCHILRYILEPYIYNFLLQIIDYGNYCTINRIFILYSDFTKYGKNHYKYGKNKIL
jgi:hypothetical protein